MGRISKGILGGFSGTVGTVVRLAMIKTSSKKCFITQILLKNIHRLEKKIIVPNTYTQFYIHCVFAVKFRKAVLEPSWDERLRLYLTAIAQNNGHKMLAINNVLDHLHFFVGLNQDQSISSMMQQVKGDSSEWINKEKLTSRKFQWQGGYGAFSHSKSQIDGVVKYILNQQEHHKKITFLDEYMQC